MPFLKTERSKGLIRIWQFLIAQQTLKDWGELKNLKLNRYRFIEKKQKKQNNNNNNNKNNKKLNYISDWIVFRTGTFYKRRI